MSELTATIRPDGTVEIHLDLPPGEQCDAMDATIRAVSALLGMEIEDAPRSTAVPNGIPQRGKVGGGS